MLVSNGDGEPVSVPNVSVLPCVRLQASMASVVLTEKWGTHVTVDDLADLAPFLAGGYDVVTGEANVSDETRLRVKPSVFRRAAAKGFIEDTVLREQAAFWAEWDAWHAVAQQTP